MIIVWCSRHIFGRSLDADISEYGTVETRRIDITVTVEPASQEGGRNKNPGVQNVGGRHGEIFQTCVNLWNGMMEDFESPIC